ncbi:peptidase U32 family protein [Desulfosarcina ovata]|uniref:Peptidase U32 n=1 Tax=Desulfosarcina ovata subsp. ovata TaxID=2752305 RepID=A0A5K8AIL1_9BACT|nr:peptidase U32 family protein [Desulfosarcina ovata]BBO92398.1 peptidase U32 [Desulfosarcina ovata subsp. ovata]
MNATNAHQPIILAPAGNRAAFLAALAAGADAIYCGLKSMSARMEAKNFSLEELAQLVRLAHDRGTKVYVTLNTLIKPDEVQPAGQIIDILGRQVRPDALIVQDPGVVGLARQAGFDGEIHLSTLANVSFPRALGFVARHLNVDRVVVPRELSIDEIKAMAGACPKTLSIEAFIHGALCYGVSGRCYWSSYMGGKSGLRGRCVQPCRRYYRQGGQAVRTFSCQDFSVDVLVKILGQVKKVVSWKIEGRKKGPHYVYYTVTAYRMLRDQGHDVNIKRDALALLDQALGRERSHYRFLPQRPQTPIDTRRQTASGLFMGKVQGPAKNPWVVVRHTLLPGDVLRIGYEDEAVHSICRVTRHVPQKGRYPLKLGGTRTPRSGAPVFLTDRREKALEAMIAEVEAGGAPPEEIGPSTFTTTLPTPMLKKQRPLEMRVGRTPTRSTGRHATGIWLSETAVANIGRSAGENLWIWLPPVLWPDDQDRVAGLVSRSLEKGVRRFVLNMPWQMALFNRPQGLTLWAGPFCNAANALCLESFRTLGFAGAFVSPELGETGILTLCRQRPLPLGIVLSGHWPLCISRTLADGMKLRVPFESPRGEQAWAEQHGPDYWIFPNWKLDITEKRRLLEQAGMQMFVHLDEPVPPTVTLKKRPGLWNWSIGLK